MTGGPWKQKRESSTLLARTDESRAKVSMEAILTAQKSYLGDLVHDGIELGQGVEERGDKINEIDRLADLRRNSLDWRSQSFHFGDARICGIASCVHGC